MKRLFVIIIATLALAFSAKAQEFTPGWNLSAQGGVNYTASDLWQIDNLHHFTSDAQIALGYKFSPWFGLRGAWSGPVGSFPNNEGTEMGILHYAQLGLDAMFDIANLFNYNPTRFLSPYLFLGGAGNYRFETTNDKAVFGPAVRAGLGFAIRLDDVARILLEVQDNALSNKFNTFDDMGIFGTSWDDNLAALIGLQFDLTSGRAAKPVIDPGYAAPITAAADAEAARLAAERAAAERAAAERAAAQQRPAPAAPVQESIYFDLNKSVLKNDQIAKIDHLVSVLRQNPAATITISGYADKATGTANRNMTLSEQRANAVKKALTDAGIAANRITTEFYGDTQQVSGVPEQNRVAVCITK
ncbi:MAG: OmpA family protein [Bacteroidales bacterium]|nr:OmpA family protein [Bacteroidales bacterium]